MDDYTPTGRCGAWYLVGTSEEGRVAIPMRCRRWVCPRCGPAMRNRLCYLIEQAEPTTFVTLTCNPRRYSGPAEAFDDLGARLPDLVKRLRRRYPGSELEYLAVWEYTRNGWPHLHILLRAPYIPWQVLSSIWGELTGANVTDIRAVASAHAGASYVAKYLTKATGAYVPGRRWRASAGFLREPFRPTPEKPATIRGWKVWREDIVTLLSTWTKAGLVVEERPEGVYEARQRSALEELAHRDTSAYVSALGAAARRSQWLSASSPAPP